MKKIALALTGPLLLAPASHSTVVYQDDFDNDGLATNLGVGGILINRTLRGGNHNFADDGNLQFVTTGNTHFENKVIAYTDQTFSSAGGFEIIVNYFQTSYGGASKLAFGLASDDTNFGAYTSANNNPFTNASVYGFGVTNDSGDLTFVNGTTNTNLSNTAELGLNSNNNVVIRFENNLAGGADWSWSMNGSQRGSGTIASFDFTKNFHFLAYGQDDQGNKRINSVTVDTIIIPEVSTFAMMLGGLGVVLVRRRRA